MRNAYSMHDLDREAIVGSKKGDLANGSGMATSASAEQLRLADKIDMFLDTVSKQQEAITKMVAERKMRRASIHSSILMANNSHVGRKRSNISSSSIVTSSVMSFRPRKSPVVPRRGGGVPVRQQPPPVLRHDPSVKKENFEQPRQPLTSRIMSARPANDDKMTALKKNPASRPRSSRNTPEPSTPIKPLEVGHVQSKVRQDRNYQPPRHKSKVSGSGSGRMQHQSSSKSGGSRSSKKVSETPEDDYGEDFEEDDEDDDHEANENEDDTDRVMAKQKEEWLYDQAIRGRARQKAAMAMIFKGNGVGHHPSYPEKESSKDSAYGFSGGETSRLQTREPTPDTGTYQRHNHHHNLVNVRHQQITNNLSKRKQFLNSLGTTVRPTKGRHPKRPYVTTPTRTAVAGNKRNIGNRFSSASSTLADSIVNDPAKIDFLNKVTKDVLNRGVFTDKAIRRALENQLTNHRIATSLSVMEKSSLLSKLRQDFGIDPPVVVNDNHRRIEGKKRGSLKQRSLSENSSSSSNLPPKMTLNGGTSPLLVEDVDDDIACIILRDESDAEVAEIIRRALGRGGDEKQSRSYPRSLDDKRYASPHTDEDEEEEEDVKESRPRDKPPEAVKSPGKLFESLNLSNLNVSFNSSSMAEAKRRLEESRTQALLVKSFAYNQEKAKAAATTNRKATVVVSEKTDNKQYKNMREENSEPEEDHDQRDSDKTVDDSREATPVKYEETVSEASQENVDDEPEDVNENGDNDEEESIVEENIQYDSDSD